jgi:DNA-binding transcriptional MerR regulator
MTTIDEPGTDARCVPALMTINEVAAALRVHRNTLNRWRRAGIGPPEFTLPNGSLRFTRDQVLSWLDQQGMGR